MSILKNSIWNIAGYAVPTLIAIPAFGYIARKIGVELFGLYTLSMIVIGYASVFDAGLTRAVVREVALLKNNDRDSRSLLLTSALAVLFLGFIGSGLMLALKEKIILTLNISSDYHYDISKSITLLALLMPVFLVTQVFLADLEGREYFGHLNIQRSIGNSLIAGIPAIAVHLNHTLFSAIIGITIARLFCLWLSYYYIQNRITFSRKCISLVILKRLFSYGGWVTVSNIISPLLVSMDRFILSSVLGASKISFYTVPSELITRLSIIPGSVGKTIFPKLSKAEDFSNSWDCQKKAYKLMAFICLPVCIFLFIFSERILVLWMGPDYYGKPAVILKIMLVGFIFNCFSQIPFANIQAFGKAKYTAFIHMIEFIPYILLLYYTAKLYGMYGVAVLWMLRVIIDFFMLYSMSSKCNRMMKMMGVK